MLRKGVTLPGANVYLELREQIEQAGLLEQQVSYYLCKILFTLSLLGVGLVILMTTSNLRVQLGNAALIAFVFTQLGFLTHDLGHQQVFSSSRRNDILGLIFGNLILGMSYGWWKHKHNKHHNHPNQTALDPDINIAFLAVDENQPLRARFPTRFMIRYQAFFFLPLLTLSVLAMRIKSIAYLLTTKQKNRSSELFLIAIHNLVYLGTLYVLLGGFRSLLFCAVHESLLGIYLGLTFATNHKGMPILAPETELGFVYRQILTTRNLRPHRFVDYLYGSLSAQIEHHLFPTMPRNRLRKAGIIVKSFCERRGIAYYETGMFRAYYEIIQHLHGVGARLTTKTEIGDETR
jgi:fatty acid desaturase